MFSFFLYFYDFHQLYSHIKYSPPSALFILVGNPHFSFGTCYFFHTCLFVGGVLLFSIVFLVWNATLNCVSLTTFVIFFIYFPLYVKMAHFIFGVVDLFLLCLRWFWYLMLKSLSYSLSCSVFCIILRSFPLAYFVKGYVCTLFLR